ncbi:S9 family peptidase [Parasphingorhabdus cellanae]|uniref:S9 family peptidase n=1 Tax=Parasphingorhabdus cellanae TaxID=2806553 RepID=A0ABX7SZW8_9SPHN|nr:prolyl oligopeptidase family serine peptidase [Parasphingorhabdus cellanae]QTD54816.1 S9 family peptidase [Parasphingorhabdus cellanae]
MRASHLFAILIFGLNIGLVQPSVAAVEKIPTEIFAAEGDVYQPKLSPDGSQMVYRQNSDGKSYLTIRSLSGGKSFRKQMPEDTDLNWYRWAGNDQVLFSVSSLKEYHGPRTYLGDEFRQVEMYLIDTNSGGSRFIGLEKGAPDGDNILHLDHDGRFLLLETRESIYKYPSVYKIDLATNQAEQVVKEQMKVWDWIADNEGTVRMGLSYRANSTLVFYRRTGDSPFKRIDKVKDKKVVNDEQESLLDGFNILAGSDDGYVLSNEKTGRFGLYKFNLLTREIGEKVFDHDKNDVTRFSLSDDGTALEAAYYTDSRDRIHWFDENFAGRQKILDRSLPGQEVWISSSTRDKSKMIIYSTSPQDPGSYYLYEPAAKKMDRFAGVNDRIDPTIMAETKYETYTARDGTKIPAYVTLPKGQNAAKLPLVIMPHGGPYGVRDTMDFDMEVQFLANRGYVVLQPNFRGSGSYGESFYKLGEGQMGRSMQDDLDDGMDWLVERGIVDPQRVCIVGSSYGGYAALWGATRNPERYRCAASFAGVTDFNKQLRYDRQFFKSRYSKKWRKTVEGEDDFDLDDVSPVRKVDQLRRPILLVHGKKDSRVPYSQFTLYKEKLEDRDADAVFVTYEEEGHGLKDFENRKDWLDQLEQFLEKHNPA